MPHMPKVIALSCTHKPGRALTDDYLGAAAEGYAQVAPGCDIVHIRLIDFRLDLCVGNDECLTTGVCPLRDQFYDIIELARGATGLILGMPVYGGNVPAVLKIFMERLKTFMKASPRPFGDLDVCTLVHSRAMLTEAAMGALSPWYQRLRNRNLVSVCLTKEGSSDMQQSFAFDLCRLAGRQLAAQMGARHLRIAA